MKNALAAMMVLMAAAVFAEPAAKEAATGQTSAKTVSSALAAARAQITQITSNPKLMAKVMKTLNVQDQLQFVGDVNRAIAAMSGSVDEKIAILLGVNRSALNGAAKGNLGAVVAEIFATAPVSSLTVINENFAQDAFNRAANPKVTYTDAQYIKVAQGVMKTIVARLETADDAGLRAGFAALMMIRASNSEAPAIQDAIVATLPPSVQETAKKEWLPAALASDKEKSYEPMLGMAEGEVSLPVSEQVLRIAVVQETDATLADLFGGNTDPTLKPGEAQPVIDAVYTASNLGIPKLGVGDASSEASAQIGAIQTKVEEAQRTPTEPEPGPGPGPYPEQTTK